jgi:dethiobiotin synthetase
VVVVARTALGTINHTLLTLEALRARSLTVAGVFLVGEPVRSNTAAIAAYGGTPILAELPRLTPLTPEILAAWSPRIDPEGRLSPWLGACENP